MAKKGNLLGVTVMALMLVACREQTDYADAAADRCSFFCWQAALANGKDAKLSIGIADIKNGTCTCDELEKGKE